MDAIELHNVRKAFRTEDGQSIVAVDGITLIIPHGGFTILLGPSGCGKSTILRILSGLERTFEGTITVHPSIQASPTGFVFQQFALLPWLTVRANIALGLLARKTPNALHSKPVMRELERFQLTQFADAYPRELSGGMRQRVGFARALAVDPKVLYLDEPFSELDSFTASQLRQELLAIWRERSLTIIMVSHNIEETILLADHIAVLTPRPGRIECIVTNTLPRPRDRRSAPFFAMEDQLESVLKP